MSSNWFDFDDDVASEFFERSKVERIKKNSGLNSKKIEINENWSRSSEVNDLLDLATSKCDFRGKSKLLDSLLKERSSVRNTLGGTSRFSGEPLTAKHVYADDFFSSGYEKLTKIKTNLSNDRYETESQRSEKSKEENEQKFENKGVYPEKSASATSANSYAFSEVTNDGGRSRKDSVDSSWSRKSCQGTVNFPSSSTSTVSEACGGYSAQTIGRSISRDSDDSVCTEKSINSSTISEKLPDGTDKTQVESNESWLRKSTSGSTIAEKKVNDMMLTEKNDDGMCEKSTTRMSYLEKSATGSSLQEEVTSEKLTSSGKGGMKTVEQKTSETFKKSHRAAPNKSAYYDDLDVCSFDKFVPSSFSKMCSEDRSKTATSRRKDIFVPGRVNVVSEKISKLIDEAVQQDDLFKIPSSLQTDIDKMTDDFFNTKSFGRDRTRTHRRRLADLFSGVDKEETFITSSKITKLKSENDSLQQENIKLQSIIQDVTAVNKRWQKYNIERRLYVQKLLSTIQDLQEQINLISEKSAFQRKSKEEIGSQHGEIERLKKEHQEHLAVLELQIKSHKDDWDAERKEKKKALQEKNEMESRVNELMRDVQFLKEVLQEERRRKNIICVVCQNSYDQNETYPRMEYCSPTSPLNVSNCQQGNFCSAIHIPYKTVDIANDECYCNKGEILVDGNIVGHDRNSYSGASRNELQESFPNERFSRISKSKKPVTSDTVVVEDESGIRLAITEQFPSKDSNLKSILKKNDRKNKTLGFSRQKKSAEDSALPRTRLPFPGQPSITCEECNSSESGFGVSIGFHNAEVDQSTSFTPNAPTANDNSMHYLSIGGTGYSGGEISRSRSEPNTRSNSSENLKPLRESSSWNSESFSSDTKPKESVICPGCERVFQSPMHLKNFDHFEPCQSENNQF